jgi:hypothetical protein
LLRVVGNAAIDAVREAGHAPVGAPPPVVLDVIPRDGSRVEAVVRALSGSGGPVGVGDVRSSGDALTVEFDDALTSLRLIVDVIDAELEFSPGRQIVPLFPLGDEIAARFAGATLRAPEIDVTRLLETYSGPLLSSERAS